MNDNIFSVSNTNMSQAFVKESDEQWLHDIPPTLNALISYLSRENNGVRVYEKSNHVDAARNKTVHVMSNGGEYIVNDQSQWQLL